MNEYPPTLFAPAERDDHAAILRQHLSFQAYQCMKLLDSVPHIIMVLNRRRQLVFANEAFKRFLGRDDIEPALGWRPGEILNCIHSNGPGGCGTTEFCRECGAVKAILSSLEGHKAMNECQMLRRTRNGIEGLELQVCASPFELDDELYTVFSIADISHEKRRRALERIFFHDILNTVGGLKGLVAFLKEEAPPNLENDAGFIYDHIMRLHEEIESQRELLAAENNELQVSLMTLHSRDMVRHIAQTYSRHEIATGKTVLVAEHSCDAAFESDFSLLSRVLGNLLKNALEASQDGQTVSIGCTLAADCVVFQVNNPAYIPRDTQLKIFKRAFSTKDPTRGLGTYSVKLLTERYLNGHATFLSNENSGTTFSVALPLRPEHKAC